MGKGILDMFIYLMELLRPRKTPDKLTDKLMLRKMRPDHTTKGRLDRALSPKGEAPGSTMSYRGIFEMVAINVMRDLKIEGAWSVEVVRVRTVHDAPMYQIIITINHLALLNVQAMLDIETEIKRNIVIISKWANQGLRQISWALGKGLTPVVPEAQSESVAKGQRGDAQKAISRPQAATPKTRTERVST